MSLTRHCDREGCDSRVEICAGSIDVSFMEFVLASNLYRGEFRFCSAACLTMYMFAEYPEMPLWYGPKREMETASAKE